MKKFIVISGLTFLFCHCSTSSLEEKLQLNKYKNLIKTLQDTSLAKQQDSTTINPILKEFAQTYKLPAKQQQTPKNPFSGSVTQPTSEETPTTTKTKPTSPNHRKYNLTGIIKNGNSRKALINGELYEINAQINNWTVIEINDTFVILKNANQSLKLSLME
jgi:hypothetical protein